MKHSTCTCDDWRNEIARADEIRAAILRYCQHGPSGSVFVADIAEVRIEKQYRFCPYCGAELVETSTLSPTHEALEACTDALGSVCDALGNNSPEAIHFTDLFLRAASALRLARMATT